MAVEMTPKMSSPSRYARADRPHGATRRVSGGRPLRPPNFLEAQGHRVPRHHANYGAHRLVISTSTKYVCSLLIPRRLPRPSGVDATRTDSNSSDSEEQSRDSSPEEARVSKTPLFCHPSLVVRVELDRASRGLQVPRSLVKFVPPTADTTISSKRLRPAEDDGEQTDANQAR